MDNKELHATNIKDTDVEGTSSNVAPNVRTMDMSGTNAPDATKNPVMEAEKRGESKANARAEGDMDADETDYVRNLHADDSHNRRGVVKNKSKVKVKLNRPHTHEGVEYEAHDEIEVDEASAAFIEEAKAGKIVNKGE